MHYTALTPIYRPAGVNATTYTRTGALVTSEQFYVEWKELGPASDMADAKRLYGGYPVLKINFDGWSVRGDKEVTA